MPPPSVIRPYAPADRAAVRALCADTGFLGRPIDPVFEDRELFADFLTNYYLRHEPDSAFVLQGEDGALRGYLLGCLHPLRCQAFNAAQNLVSSARLLVRYPRYGSASRKFIRWMLLHAWREVPAAPRRTPHFHVNLVPEARGVREGTALLERFVSHLTDRGVRKVYGQMASFETRRGEKMFRRYGFRVVNRAEITKYREFHPAPVYLSTVVRDLDEVPLVGAPSPRLADEGALR